MAIGKILDHLGLSTPETAKPPPPTRARPRSGPWMGPVTRSPGSAAETRGPRLSSDAPEALRAESARLKAELEVVEDRLSKLGRTD
jgi:hypothetical protein